MGVGRLLKAGIAAALIVLAGCAAQPTAGGSPVAGRGGRGTVQGPVPVTTTSVVLKTMPVQINVIGSAEPVNTVSIRSQITGQLTAVNFTEGDEVAKGQLLFSLDRRPLEDRPLEEAEARMVPHAFQVLQAAVGQVVEAVDLVASGDQALGQVGSDEAGDAGDRDLHDESPGL